MDAFLTNNRDELIARCKANVSQRPLRAATEQQLSNGVPLFLDQLIRTLEAEKHNQLHESLRISGGAGGESSDSSEIGVSATAHGGQLLELGYTVDQVVHDYGDLCQAISSLAEERDAPFSIAAFRTLNRCLDNAIAEAVTEFSAQRDAAVSRRQSTEATERLGFLIHELRNSLGTATLAFTALETGKLSIVGATGAVMKRSLATLTSLVNHALDEVRESAELSSGAGVFSLANFVTEAGSAALLDANARGCAFSVGDVDTLLEISADRELLLGSLMNLIQNAFKFTMPHTDVSLHAYASEGGAICIDVEDHCGGLSHDFAASMFRPFVRGLHDKTGLGLGLSIARANVEAAGGTLTVLNKPGSGCVFTIRLDQHVGPLQ